MTRHLSPQLLKSDRTRTVVSVEEFVLKMGLDAKQKRDLLNLFGAYATRHELLSNCTLPRVARH